MKSNLVILFSLITIQLSAQIFFVGAAGGVSSGGGSGIESDPIALTYPLGDIANKQDILTGSESVFANWDKNVSNDFDGVYASLTSRPTITLTGGNVSGTINLNTLVATLTANVTAGVSSVFGRTGAVVAQSSDYSSFYEPIFSKNTGFNLALGTTSGTVSEGNHTHTENDITDLSHFTGADITGNETAFNGWDKDASDDLQLGSTGSTALAGNTTTITTGQANDIVSNNNHRINTSNPHNVTASQVGLGNVNNTSDANKPISTATQAALNLKENTFSKNTAFNKNFGSTSGTVAQGGDIRILNGQTAFTWGNHASAGYLTSGDGYIGSNQTHNAGGILRMGNKDIQEVKTMSFYEFPVSGFTWNLDGGSSEFSIARQSKLYTFPMTVATDGTDVITKNDLENTLNNDLQLTWNDSPNQLIIDGGNAVIISGFANATHTHTVSEITDIGGLIILSGTYDATTANTNTAIPAKSLFWGTNGQLHAKNAANEVTQITGI